MKKLISSLWFKIICLVLINAFFLLDICWAGNMDFSVGENMDKLSAPIQISEADFYNTFLVGNRPAEMLSKLNETRFFEKEDLLTNDRIKDLLKVDDQDAISPRLNYFAALKQALILGWNKTQAVYVFYNFRFIRFIQPLRSQWYILRLGLKTDHVIDMFIIQRINSSYNRQELLDSLRSSVKILKKKQKIITLDQAFVESNALLEKRYSAVLKKLSRMGTDAFYFKPLKLFIPTKDKSNKNQSTLQSSYLATAWAFFISSIDKMDSLTVLSALVFGGVVIVSSVLVLKKSFYKHLRVFWYSRRLGLVKGRVADLVIKNMIEKSNSRGQLIKQIITEINNLKSNGKNKLDRDLEKRLREILFDKLVKSRLLKKQTIVNVYLELSESRFLDIAADAIFSLKDYLNDIDQARKIKLILKLQNIVDNKEKEVKKSKPLFRRSDAYTQKHAAKKQELLRFQALYIHMGMDILSDFEESENINDIIKIVASFKKYVDLLGNDVLSQCNGYLDQILAVLIKTKDQLALQLKPESLPKMIINNIPGKNNEAAKQVKTRLVQTDDQIKIVSGLLKQLEEKRNNYGLLSKLILRTVDIVVATRDLRRKKVNIDVLEKENIGLIGKNNIDLIEQTNLGLIDQAI